MGAEGAAEGAAGDRPLLAAGGLARQAPGDAGHGLAARPAAQPSAEILRALALMATGLDLRPAVEIVADWESAPQTWAALRGKTVLTRIGTG